MSLQFIFKAPPRRRFVDTPSSNTEWQKTHREADRAYPGVVDLFLRTFQDTKNAVPRQALLDFLTAQNEPRLVELITDIWSSFGEAKLTSDLPPLIIETVDRAGQAVIPDVKGMLAIETDFVFDVTNDRAVSWIDGYVGQQIREISTGTLTAVRETIHAGFTQGLGIDDMATRLTSSIGLTSRQSASLEQFRLRLIAEGLTQATVQERIAARADLVLNRRVQSIARTETIDASQQALQSTWEQAQDQGFWDDTVMRRFWLVTPDGRNEPPDPCPEVPGMNPDGRRLHEPFQTPLGERMQPTLHVNCRCSLTARSVV